MTSRRSDLRLLGALFVAYVGFALPEHASAKDPNWFIAPVEFFFLCVLTLLLPRWRIVRGALTLGSVLWVLVVTSHRVIERIYERAPAVIEDWRLALNLLHFVEAASSPRVWGPAVAGVIAFVCFGAAVLEVQRGLQDRATRRLLAVCLCGLAVAWNAEVAGQPPHAWLASKDPVATFGLRPLQANWRMSKIFYDDLREASDGPVDRRHEALISRRLQRKPNVYFLMIEAYGEVLFLPPVDTFTRALMARVQDRLAAKGFGARTFFSEAPIYGGGSWLSMATMQVGVRVDRPSRFAMLERVGTRVPGLTRFFEAQGYETYGLFPGNTNHRGLGRHDIYGRKHLLEGSDFVDFKGHIQPWGAAPDQYAWGAFFEKFPNLPSPRFVTSMSVSTHWSWWYHSPYVSDWHTLGDPDETNDPIAPGWDPLPLPTNAGHYEPMYAESVEYEWRVLLDVIFADPTEDAVFLLIGDHQPYLGPEAKRGSFRTPVHVITRHAPTLAAFEQAGFGEGLFVEPPATTTLWHEGFFSLVVSRMLIADGQDAEGLFFPRGVSVTGLHAVSP